MTHPQEPEDMQRVFQDCDPVYLRQLRQAAGMEVTALARTACLSVAQVRHLEGEGEGFFYSPSIKRQSYKRLLMILGAAPPTANPQEALQAAAHGLENRVALGEPPQALAPISSSANRWAPSASDMRHAMWLALLALGVWGVVTVAPAPLRAWFEGLNPVANAPQPLATPSASGTGGVPVVPTSEPVPMANASAPALPPMSTGAPRALAALPDSVTSCVHTSEALPELVPAEAHKVGNYVYLVSDKPMTVCVVDAAQQATWLELKPGEGRSVYGKSPWQLTGAQLYQAQIYFQGRRLTLPEGKPQRLSLVEKPLAR